MFVLFCFVLFCFVLFCFVFGFLMSVNVPSICDINSDPSHRYAMIHMVPAGASTMCRPLRRQRSWAGGRIQQGQQNRVLHLRVGG